MNDCSSMYNFSMVIKLLCWYLYLLVPFSLYNTSISPADAKRCHKLRIPTELYTVEQVKFACAIISRTSTQTSVSLANLAHAINYIHGNATHHWRWWRVGWWIPLLDGRGLNEEKYVQ